MVAEIIFLISAGLLAYTFMAYPAFMLITSLNVRRKNIKPPESASILNSASTSASASAMPSVSILMPVHNEEKVLRHKICCLLASDYPHALMEIIIGSDASDDSTDRIIEEFVTEDERLQFYRSDIRLGKAAILNVIAGMSKNEILIITDANVIPSPGAIKLLAVEFLKPETGLCDATVTNTGRGTEGVTIQENFYSRIESVLKRAEGDAWGTMTGPYGGFYAVRKSIFPSLPPNLLVDDLYVGLTTLKRGFFAYNSPGAMVYEDISPGMPEQFRRRTRIAAGSFQNLFHFGPFPGKSARASFCFFSHKVLRWFSPLLLAALFMTTVILSAHSVLYFCLLSIQFIFIFLSALDMILYYMGKTLTPLRFTTQFLLMNAAMTAGFLKSLRGIEKGTWEPTKRV